MRSVSVTGPRNSRQRSAAVTVSGGLIMLISHLPRRVAAPVRAWRDIFALHEEGVGGEHRALTQHYVVVDEGAYPDRAASADRCGAGFERAVLLRLALDDA